MINCGKCGAEIDDGSGFCQSCGASVDRPPGGESKSFAGFSLFALTLERLFFFRTARGFAWLICFAGGLILIAALYRFVQLTPSMFGGSASVSKLEIEEAIAAERANKKIGGSYSLSDSADKIDPELLSQLDKRIYEIIVLLPPNFQSDDGREKARYRIRRVLRNFEDVRSQVAVADDARRLVKDFTIDERVDALFKYFDLKIFKVSEIKAQKAQAQQEFYITAGVVASAILTITLAILIMVLLAIEQNTRRTVPQPQRVEP